MIALTLPEIRRLLTRLVLREDHPADHIWAWSHGDDDDNTKPAYPLPTTGPPTQLNAVAVLILQPHFVMLLGSMGFRAG